MMNDVYNYMDSFLSDSDTIVLGCSGGPDSMCLLSLLLKLRKVKNLSIICAHVDHNVRDESSFERKWLSDFCVKNNIPFESMVIENYGDDNFENEARNIRYNYFEELIKKYDAKYLMTAHHGDDLIETILMKIVRGSNLSGYSGFKMVVDNGFYKIVRPLITVTKEEIIEYNEKHKIDYVIDKTNFLDIHTRNRYRKVVLPFLKSEDASVHGRFLKYSRTLQMYDDYINGQMKSQLDKVYQDGKIIVDKFLELDYLIALKIIHYLLEEFYDDDMVLISDVHAELIIDLIKSSKANSSVYLPNSVKAVKNYNSVSIKRETEQIDKYEIEISNYVSLPNGKVIEAVSSSSVNDNNYCRLCKKDVCFPLIVRTRRSGDKMYVKGLGGSKKLKDIFIDMKIPIWQRDIWPVVVDSKDNIVWIPGVKKSKFDVAKNKNCDIILRYY